MRKTGLVVYFLVLSAHCCSILAGWEVMRMTTKMLLIPILILYILLVSGGGVPVTVYVGLLFAYLGDVILLQDADSYFLAAMLSFIISHICYSIYFSGLQQKGGNRLREAYAAAVVVTILSGLMFCVLNPYLGPLRLPILAYMVIISIMSILAANTAGNPALRKIALSCFIPGAALFVVSDAVLALDRFVYHLPRLQALVMLSYGFAQYFLARGFIRAGLRF